MPSSACAAIMPPSNAMASVHNTINGIDTASASSFGRINRNVCGMPITAIASSSCVTRITPSCAVIAEPERPATKIAASTGPSSRITLMPRMLMINASAPNSLSCCDDKKLSTTPIRKPTSAVMPSA